MIRVSLISIGLLICTVYSLETPTLLSVTLVDSTKITVTWRDNSVDEKGFLVLRKTSQDQYYAVVDTAGPNVQSYGDSNLAYSTTYYYTIMAFNDTSVSDSSSPDSARTNDRYIPPPPLGYSTYQATVISNAVKITIHDGMTIEKGYRIIRSKGLYVNQALSNTLIAEIISVTPSDTGSINYIDSTVVPETWYTYLVCAFNDTATFSSSEATVFTYFGRPIPPLYASYLGNGSAHWHNWAHAFNDTLFVEELYAGMPGHDTITFIDITDPAKPSFLGYGDDSISNRWKYLNFPDYKTALNGTVGIDLNWQCYGYNCTPECMIHLYDLTHIPFFPTSIDIGGVDCSSCTPRCDSSFCALIYRSGVSILGVGDQLHYCFFKQMSSVILDPVIYAANPSLLIYPYLIIGVGSDLYAMNIFDTALSKIAEPGFGIVYLAVDKEHNLLIVFSQDRFNIYSINIGVGVDKSKNTHKRMPLMAYPNPFNPNIIIELPTTSSNVKLTIYDIAGNNIYENTRVKERKIIFSGDGLAPGIYFLKTEMDGKLFINKVILQR